MFFDLLFFGVIDFPGHPGQGRWEARPRCRRWRRRHPDGARPSRAVPLRPPLGAGRAEGQLDLHPSVDRDPQRAAPFGPQRDRRSLRPCGGHRHCDPC
eukprot:15443430-Heterocapsa_arctica.AAC.1